MIYVVQVSNGFEAHVKKSLLFYSQDNPCVQDVFYPLRERRYKINGEWVIRNEKLFPGYIFVETNDSIDLFRIVKRIPEYARLLAVTSVYKDKKLNFIPLSEEEEMNVNRLCPSRTNHLTEISEIAFHEGGKVEIMRGPLQGLESQIVKIDKHARTATIRIEILGQFVDTKVGIDLVRPMD